MTWRTPFADQFRFIQYPSGRVFKIAIPFTGVDRHAEFTGEVVINLHDLAHSLSKATINSSKKSIGLSGAVKAQVMRLG